MCHARGVCRLCSRHHGDRRDGDHLRLVGSLAPVGVLRRRNGGGRMVCPHKAAKAQVHCGRDRRPHRAQPPGARGATFDCRGARAGWRPHLVLPAHGGDHQGRGEGRPDGLSEEGVHWKDRKAALHRRRNRGGNTRAPFCRVPRRDASSCDASACPGRGGRQHLRFVAQGHAWRQGHARGNSAYARARGERRLPVARVCAYALRRKARGSRAHGSRIGGRRRGTCHLLVLLSARHEELQLPRKLWQRSDARVQGRGRAGAEVFRKVDRGSPSRVYRPQAGHLHQLRVDCRPRGLEDHGVREAVAPWRDRCAHAPWRRNCSGCRVGRRPALVLVRLDEGGRGWLELHGLGFQRLLQPD